jgi:predicted regulator of Ras-like GTPase activity (Roadblock/LC7/MglB family)
MFKEPLEAIMERTDGSIGALIMGTDGIAVEKILRPEGRDANLDIAAAEFTSLVRNAQRTGADTGLGGLQELVVCYDDLNVIMRSINQEYFLVLALRPDGNLGRGRFEMRKAQLELASEFVI